MVDGDIVKLFNLCKSSTCCVAQIFKATDNGFSSLGKYFVDNNVVYEIIPNGKL